MSTSPPRWCGMGSATLPSDGSDAMTAPVIVSPVVVTGAAGFIGLHVAERLLDRGETVIGGDVFNDYYNPGLKAARAARLEGRDGFRMVRLDIAEHEALAELVRASGAKRVI